MIIEWYRALFLFLWKYLGFFGGIVGISAIISLICIPLYRVIGRMVGMENALQAVLTPAIAKIKASYSEAADRQSAIERLYARFGYHPIMGVRKVFPLFVAIPFLMLTYYMLSGTTELEGVKWLCFDDVSKPDGMLFGFNLLPFVMTGINLLTAFATPCMTAKDRNQAIFIALLFLVLLYTANAALMIYWCLNQLFNLLRTLFENHCAGAQLLVKRIAGIPSTIVKLVRSSLALLKSPAFLAYGTLALIVLSIYFCLASKIMMGIIDGLTINVMYRGMTFVVAMASAASFVLLWRDKFVHRAILIFSTFSCMAFSVYFAALFLLSRAKFIQFFEYVNLFYVLYTLLAIWLLPYIFQKSFIFFNGAGRDLARAFKANAYLLLFPIIFSIHYAYSSAVFILPPISLVLLIVYLIALPVALGLFLVLLFRRWIAVDVLAKIASGVCIAIYIMPMLSYGSGMFGCDNNIAVRLVVMALIPFILIKFLKRTPAIVFSVLLLAMTIVNSVAHHGSDMVASNQTDVSYDARMRQVIGDAHCVKSNNVYFLVYDSYPHQSENDELNLQGHETYDLLRANGFTLYDAYSMAGDTMSSMSRVFQLGGVSGGSGHSTVAGDNIFSDFLRSAGYKTSYLLEGYTMPNRGERMPGDFYFPRAADITRPELVLFPCIIRGSLSQSPQVFNSYTHDDWMREYRSVVSNFTDHGNFVYAHSPYPTHANWFPRDRKSDEEEQAAFRERLVVANQEIAENINLAIKDPNAIIIFASDHGPSMLIPQPYGNWGARHLMDHFGVMLAIRWPKDYKPCLQLNCLQNVLLEVMIYLSDDRSLSRLEISGETIALEYPLLVPANVIKSGIIQSGPDAGKSLFDAAKEDFRRKRP